MDRTKASDAFNAGSIPVGRIIFLFFYRGKLMSNENHAKKSSRVHDEKEARQAVRKAQTPIKQNQQRFMNYIVYHKKRVMLAVLGICLVGVVVLAFHATRPSGKTKGASAAQTMTSDVYAIPDVPLEKNAYEKVNHVIHQYYDAYAAGDIDTIASISEGMSETTKTRLKEVSKYIEPFPKVEVYTKPGPVDGSYIAYVDEEYKFKDYETPVPGMETYYICTRKDGSCYINLAENDEATSEYIKKISLEDDVIDLNNKITADYNEMVDKDKKLKIFLSKFYDNINKAAAAALAENGGSSGSAAASESGASASAAASGASTQNADAGSSATAGANGSTVSTEGAQTGDTGKEQAAAADTATTQQTAASSGAGETKVAEQKQTASGSDKIKANDVVNVRKSASTNAESLGKTTVGSVYTRIKVEDNGWSKIKFEGGEGYVKTEYFEKVKAGESSSTTSKEQAKTETTKSKSSSISKGTHTLKDTVNIREKASTSASRVAVAYAQETVNVLEVRSDGWAKVSYNKKTGYIKTEYLK